MRACGLTGLRSWGGGLSGSVFGNWDRVSGIIVDDDGRRHGATQRFCFLDNGGAGGKKEQTEEWK